jgi:hypothetical protein
MFILSMSLISKAFVPDSIFGRDRLAREYARRLKHPITLGATGAQKMLTLNPDLFACHSRTPSSFASRQLRQASTTKTARELIPPINP